MRVVSVLAPFLMLLLAGPAGARTVSVGAGGTASTLELENAIQEAESGDTILVHPGVYENALIYLASKSLVIKSVAGPEKTILDGGGARVVVWLYRTTEATVFEGFTVRNGSDRPHGGGIRIGESSNPTIRNNIVEGCRAPWGGGIFVGPQSKAVIEGNLIKWNQSGVTGGGICVQGGTPTIRNNTFVGNASEKPGNALAIFNASPIVENNLFAQHGGESALYVSGEKCAPVLRCNGYFGNQGPEVAAADGTALPEETNRRKADPLFADAKTYRLSQDSPYRNAGACGKIGR